MLNIPSLVVTLLKRDGVRKNFRVVFPNGEYDDITNENVVCESVKFSESICSQDTFRFGLAESSRIEFETVGIGNMLGMDIKCYCEVDLTGETISGIVDWSGDGETVTLENSDLGYPFFRIPYGLFTVQSCPRNHEAMTHRKVTAISTMFHNNSYMCPFEQAKIAARWMNVENYRMRVKEFVAENLAYYDLDILNFLGYTSTTSLYTFGTLGNSESFSSPTFKFYNSSNQLVQTVTVSGSIKQRYLSVDGTVDGVYDYLAGVVLSGYDTIDNRSNIRELLNNTIDFSKTMVQESSSSYGVDLVDIDDAINTLFGLYLYPYVLFSTVNTVGEGVWRDQIKNTYRFIENSKQAVCFYPNIAGVLDDTSVNSERIVFPYAVTFIFDSTSSGGSMSMYGCYPTSQLSRVYGYRYNDSLSNKYYANRVAVFNATLGSSDDDSQPRSFVNAFSFAKVLESYCELCGLFCKRARDGGIKLISLNTTTFDNNIYPANYSELWWDEYDVEPVSQFEYSYIVQGEYNEETETDIYIVSAEAGSIYSLKDNYILQNFSRTARHNILIAVRSSDLCKIIRDISFVPIEMTMQGYPQIEAGDRLKIHAADGTEVITYALQCELSGIQNLQEYITASVGDVIAIEDEYDE